MNDDLDTGHGKLSAADAHLARQRLASSHAALFPTRLALARWRHGGEMPHLHEGNPPLRAAWCAHAVRDYQAWLDRGGFAQHEDAFHADALPPPLEPARPSLDGDTQHLGTCT
ncbi:hypothetical protein [Massilia sp. ST3]|uniref:hypothetical protein n=1 Tax=Massilia sp. ST3 TaxID=2824903 RepID=UPI001B812DD4|nr:hypothetical protein [Massilia sp. ST3]MBQ5949601.1 hypothetical protein [Massilia sp. ST3]